MVSHNLQTHIKINWKNDNYNGAQYSVYLRKGRWSHKCCTKQSCRSLRARLKLCKKIWGRRWNFFPKSARRCFTPVIEIKPSTFGPQWNFYADIHLIRGRFWLQLWTLKKFSERSMSLNDGSKEVENGESWTCFAANAENAVKLIHRTTS